MPGVLPNRSGNDGRRTSVGYLPAIPFVIVHK